MTLVIAFSQQNTFDVVKLIRRICSNTSSNTSGDQLAKGSVTTTLDARQRELQLTSVRSERGMPDVYSQALYTSTESDQHHSRRLQLFSRVRNSNNRRGCVCFHFCIGWVTFPVSFIMWSIFYNGELQQMLDNPTSSWIRRQSIHTSYQGRPG